MMSPVHGYGVLCTSPNVKQTQYNDKSFIPYAVPSDKVHVFSRFIFIIKYISLELSGQVSIYFRCLQHKM